MFRSTPPHGGRRSFLVSVHHQSGFDPRPRTEGDQGCWATFELNRVSIHAPARRATAGRRSASDVSRFRSTPPHGGRRRARAGAWRQYGFDPRPRTEGDLNVLLDVAALLVSIHAPARRATLRRVHGADYGGVSIHAPARRATCFRFAGRSAAQVSIYAPARRATVVWTGMTGISEFRSTPPHGGRPPVI